MAYATRVSSSRATGTPSEHDPARSPSSSYMLIDAGGNLECVLNRARLAIDARDPGTGRTDGTRQQPARRRRHRTIRSRCDGWLVGPNKPPVEVRSCELRQPGVLRESFKSNGGRHSVRYTPTCPPTSYRCAKGRTEGIRTPEGLTALPDFKFVARRAVVHCRVPSCELLNSSHAPGQPSSPFL